MARDDDLAGVQAAFAYQCALVGNGSLTEDSFKSCKEAAGKLFDGILQNLYPWEKDAADSARKAKANDLIDLYKRWVGDPDDPEFMAQLNQDLEAERERRKQTAPESDEDRIERLMRARAAR